MRKKLCMIMAVLLLLAGCGNAGNKQTLSFGTSQIEITTDDGYYFDVNSGELSNAVLSAKVSFVSGDAMTTYISTLISYAAKNYFIDARRAADTHGNTRIYYICSHDGKTYYEGILWIENSDVGVFMQTASAEGISAFEHIQFKVLSSSNPITAENKLSSLYGYIMGDVGTKNPEEQTGDAIEEAITQGEEKSGEPETVLVEKVDTSTVHKEDLENIASLYSLKLTNDTETDELTSLIKYESEDGSVIMNYVVPKDNKTTQAMYEALIQGMRITENTNPVAQMVEDSTGTTYNFAFHDAEMIVTVRTLDKTICDGIMACFGYRYDVITSDVSLNDGIITPTDTTTATIEGTQATGYFLGDPIYAAGNIQTKLSDKDRTTLEKALSILEKAIEKEEKYNTACAGYFTMDADSIAFNDVEPDSSLTFPALIFMEDLKCYAQVNITVINLSSEAQKAVSCISTGYSLY